MQLVWLQDVLVSYRVRLWCEDIIPAERLLKAFSNLSLTFIHNVTEKELMPWLTPLSSVPQEILQRLGSEASLYRQLEIHNTGKRLGE